MGDTRTPHNGHQSSEWWPFIVPTKGARMTIYSTNRGSDMRREPDDADIEKLKTDGRTVYVVRDTEAGDA
jgi:hypothetical protein